ncbi:c-type cytochrome [Thalassospira xiamenensis]|uniref:c-type cytochrome n=1 Tax=Thalassospira xiamenensis TaxID=220697 RepID=UPI000DEE0843|nr:cytochrome c [Thalassospira xiamenensis]RCK38516.1 cytochrome C [Thalassospira xiamenensis]
MKHFVTAGLMTASLALGLGAFGTAQADEAMDNEAVQTRQMLMDGIGGAMGTLGCYMKGQCELPDGVIRNLANGIAFSASAAPAAFEQNTAEASVKTTAKPDVWTNWDEFAGRFPEMKTAALNLAAATGDKGAMGAALGELGKSCKGCHDEYRSK